MSAPSAAAAGIQSVVDRLLRLDEDLAEGVAELEGAVVEVHVQGFDWRFQLHPSSSGIAVIPVEEADRRSEVAADLLVSGPPFTLLRLFATLQSVDGVLPTDVSISGDLRLGPLPRLSPPTWASMCAKNVACLRQGSRLKISRLV
jgi:ubiquinone biosynthesis protein UbiJ